ncbi:MAG: redoxin domain-containing protein [Chitinophagaceae bacterium]|nr:redoxin domain-containing protein [Chitinophagaceae bacterium]
MKRLIPLIVLLFAVACSRAQTDSTFLYLRFPTVPPFTITKVADSTRFTKADLSRKKATIIIIFSPDCEHCQHETRELTANIKLFKKAQIIMASPLEHPILKKFYDEYGLAAYPNIIMGRDPSYFLGTFYNIRSFPAIFVYDKKGNFVKAFDGTAPVNQIAEIL